MLLEPELLIVVRRSSRHCREPATGGVLQINQPQFVDLESCACSDLSRRFEFSALARPAIGIL
jgi:hypothetical protein